MLNMEDIAFYESEGREHRHLAKKSNGLPFPLESEVIDTSENPGRWVLKKGFVESIGATMWISKTLLNTLEIDLSSLLNSSFLQVVDLGAAIKIEALDHCFVSSGDGEAEVQNQLRSLLFNK